MENYKLHPIAALVFAIVIPLVLIATVVGLHIFCWKPWAWLFIPGIVALTYFAAEPVVVLEKKLIARAKREDVEQE